jgi:hypothetical protein
MRLLAGLRFDHASRLSLKIELVLDGGGGGH